MRRWAPFLLLCMSAEVGVEAQYWANDFGGAGADAVADVKVDPDGAIYVIGEFSFAITYDGQTISSAGATDAFVAKLDASGGLIWMVGAGGAGIDRGLKVAVDGSGAVAVTGQFMGTADLFGTTLTSASGTQDVFTARLNATTGAADWVRAGGATVGSDRPYGVALSPNGNLTVAGEFRGTATFSGSTLVSMIDPFTLQSSVDVFVASYDASGALLWLQQGAAPFTDRAIDIVSDAASNLYVCGQFSDTITFDAPHNNTISNATFLLKLDAAGGEQWFRRFGGATFNHVRDMQLTDTGELLVCGEIQGQALFFDSAPDAIDGVDAYAYYLLRCDPNGEHIDHAVGGSQNPVGVAGLDQRGGTVAVFGDFHCRFTGLSNFYSGAGLFMATGQEDLFIARHDFPTLNLTDAQQFGGQHHKYAGGIASLSFGQLVFGGGYEALLTLPSDGDAWGDAQSTSGSCPLVSMNDGLAYCGDPNYGYFAALNSSGSVDGFVARAYVEGRSPYDAWNRQGGTGCDRSALEPCVLSTGYTFPDCVDSVRMCGPGPLFALHADPSIEDRAFSYWEDGSPPCGIPSDDSTAYTGWDVAYAWSDGSTGYSVPAMADGWYWCTVAALNGCWSWTDSVFVVIEPQLTPLISDGLGVNVDALSPEDLLCVDPVWLWYGGLPPGYQCYWQSSLGETVAGDSVHADTSALYMIVLTSPAGCITSNFIEVVIGDATPMPNITAAVIELDVPDTMVQCPYTLISGYTGITWYVDGVPAPADPGLTVHVTDALGSGYYAPMGDVLTWFVLVTEPGWVPVEMTIEVMDPPCGSDTLVFVVSDSVFVEFVPWSDVSIEAPPTICPGVVVPLSVTCTGCDSILWTGPGFVAISTDGDTAWIDQPGLYEVLVTGEYMGLTCPAAAAVFVEDVIPPVLAIDPPDGIICPGATAIISTTFSALDYQWIGPLGVIPGSNDSITVSATGEYFLTAIDPDGCSLTVGPVTIDEYGSPYVAAFPDATLCPGDPPIIIQAVVSAGATISWNAPLSGSSSTQSIDTPGTYSCWVTSCGINYLASVTIAGGTANATLLDPGPFSICTGDSVLLQGPSSMTTYAWSPGGGSNDSLWATAGGSYTLTVFDDVGCMATSSPVLVSEIAFTEPLTAPDQVGCEGDIVEVVAVGSGTITWYSGDGTIFDAGATSSMGPITGIDTVFVSQSEGDCDGPLIPVVITALPLPPEPSITGTIDLCEGGPLLLTAAGPAGASYQWTTPIGAFTGEQIAWDPALASGSGTYQVVSMISGCSSSPASVSVNIVPCDIILPNVITPNGDGDNDVFAIDGRGGQVDLSIFNRWGERLAGLSGGVVKWNGRNTTNNEPVPDGVYFYVVAIDRSVGAPLRMSGYVQLIH